MCVLSMRSTALTGSPARAAEIPSRQIVSLRLAVGLLGEQAGWWTSSFMAPASTDFLTPVFGPKILQARYQGVLEVARRVHDDHIGIGRVFHPFRLPEVLEQKLFSTAEVSGPKMSEVISSAEAARTALAGLTHKCVAPKSGPELLGPMEQLDEAGWVAEAVALYLAAFNANVQCFPYFTGAR